jgi:hypothetical protein
MRRSSGSERCSQFCCWDTQQTRSNVQSVWEIAFCALGPPVWFFLEHFMLDRGWISVPDLGSNDAFLKSIKDYADYASKIWAAVLAAVLFLYTKKP